MVPEFKDVSRTEYDTVPDQPEKTVKLGDNWGFTAFLVPVLVGIALSLMYSYQAAIVGAVVAIILITIILEIGGSTWFKKDEVIPATTKRVPREVTENKQVAEHRCCISCRRPTKALR